MTDSGPKRRDFGRLRTRLVDRWLRRAAAHEARGELGEAVGSYRAILVVEPLHLEAREQLVVALLRARRPGDAIDELAPAKPALQRVGTELKRATLRRIDAAARQFGGLEVALEVAELTTQLGFPDDARQRLRAVYRQLIAEGRTDEARALAKWHPDAMDVVAGPGRPRTRKVAPPVGRLRPTEPAIASRTASPPPIPESAIPDLDAEATAIYEPPAELVSTEDNSEDQTAVVRRRSDRALTATYGMLVRPPYYGPAESVPAAAPGESRERTAIMFGSG